MAGCIYLPVRTHIDMLAVRPRDGSARPAIGCHIVLMHGLRLVRLVSRSSYVKGEMTVLAATCRDGSVTVRLSTSSSSRDCST